MTVLDLALAVAGRSHAVLSDGSRSERRAQLVAVALFALAVIPFVVIALTPTPLELSLEELREGRYPTRTSWLRLEGELRDAGTTTDGLNAYTLHDPDDEGLAVTVIASGPLPTGHTEVTGQPLGGVREPGTFEAFYADVPTEPARRDPWPLFVLPALVALFLIAGEQSGYPVVRGERRRGQPPAPLGPDERVAARWSGRIAAEQVPADAARACTAAVAGDAATFTLTVTDERGAHAIAIRRTAPRTIGRICRTNGCVPGIELHATGSDIVLECDTRTDRDRLAGAMA
jgi:hypothetical protein